MAMGGSNSMAIGRATGLHDPMTTSKGMAAARVADLARPAPIGRRTGRSAPAGSSGTKPSSRSASSPDLPGGVGQHLGRGQRGDRGRPSAAGRRRPAPPARLRSTAWSVPAGVGDPPSVGSVASGSATVVTEAVEEAGVVVEHRQHARRRPRRAPAAPPRRSPGTGSGPASASVGTVPKGTTRIASGSRPRSSTARRSRGRASARPDPPTGIHPSAYSATAAKTAGPAPPPIRVGIRGCWTGLGQLQHGLERHVGAVELGLVLATTAPACTARARGPPPGGRRRPPRGRPPLARFHPKPMPNTTRPPLRWSRVASCLASTMGSCWATSITPVPRRIRSVTAAAVARATIGSRLRR